MQCGYTKKKGKQCCISSHPLPKPIKVDPTVETTAYNFQTISHWKIKRLQNKIQPSSFCLQTTRKNKHIQQCFLYGTETAFNTYACNLESEPRWPTNQGT